MAFGKFVDMALTAEDRKENYPTPAISDTPVYPYGLSISLTDKELAKLGLELPEIGDILDARIMMRATSVSENENTSGKCCRVECQIFMMAVEDEGAEATPAPRKLRSLPYKT